MSDTRALYEEVILDHNKNPKNFGSMPDADVVQEGYNPLCGDSFKIYLKLDGDTVQSVSFEGHGCAISKASASLMTTLVKGRKRSKVEELFHVFQEMLKSDPESPLDTEKLGKLKVFSGVREYPVRIKCATLAWHALVAALHQQEGPVSTESGS